MIVYCQSKEEAFIISSKILSTCSTSTIIPWDFSTFPDSIDRGGCFHVGRSPDMQLSIHPDLYTPQSYWNDRGSVILTAEEAISLGAFGEPAGFEPYESSVPWKKETRSHSELDQELDDYFALA